METPLIEVHRAAGARIGEYSGVALPEAFSDLEREYGAARESVALFDTSWHAVLELTGRDRVKYLHAISSNNIQALETGHGTLALLLNPQGRIQAEIEVYALPEKLLVLSHASLREQTIVLLKKYVIGSQVKIEDVTDQMGSLAIEGPRAGVIVEQACGVKFEDVPEMAIRDVTIKGIPCQLVRRSNFGEMGAEFIAGRDCLASLWGILLAGVRARGGEPIGMGALNALRLEAGVPWFPADFNDAMIPHEAALEHTHISFNKGCYTGQEIVERVRTRGHVNRKRVGLKFSTVAPPAPGTKLRAGGAEIGFVTSAAFSPDAKPAIGMGYVRREQFAPGSVVEFDGGTAEVKDSPTSAVHSQ
ncbi:MAG: aminomethyltransferase family protein [Candidatus Acidoferrales bacterium]|nr:aminomethyltransferase family protein [Candidatus Acidoferrales bacterium]